MTQQEEDYLRFLQRQDTRLNSDWSYSELTKFTSYLDRREKPLQSMKNDSHQR